MFLLNIFPSIIAAKPYKARGELQAALADYYTAKHDLEPDVAKITSARSEVYRKWGIGPSEVGKFELSLLHVATANAIPTLFWCLCFIVSSLQSTEEIRKEILSIVQPGPEKDCRKEMLLDITKFETHCPLLVSAYRETIRVGSSQVVARRVISDTNISDGKKSYLLKAPFDVQMPAAIPHLSRDTWGPDADKWDLRRFLTPEDKGLTSDSAKEADRQQKKAYLPFGGGKHLCPGRNFAFAEILGTVAVLLLGFDIKNIDGGLIVVPKMTTAILGEGVCKPTGCDLEMGARITRRKGWEDVEWKFVC